MAAHRYWRVYITAVQSLTTVAVHEIGLFKTTDCSDRCLLDPALCSVSSYSSASLMGDKCVDGKVNTYWQTPSNALPAWWQYTFPIGQEADIVGFSLSGVSSSANPTPKDFKLQYSDDGTVWTDLITVTGNTIIQGALFYGCYPFAVIVGEQVRPKPFYAGTYKINATVDRLGVPGRYRTRLCLKDPPIPLEEKWSSEAGVVVYENLANEPDIFVLEAYDHTSPNPAVAAISDQLILEPMS